MTLLGSTPSNVVVPLPSTTPISCPFHIFVCFVAQQELGGLPEARDNEEGPIPPASYKFRLYSGKVNRVIKTHQMGFGREVDDPGYALLLHTCIFLLARAVDILRLVYLPQALSIRRVLRATGNSSVRVDIKPLWSYVNSQT